MPDDSIKLNAKLPKGELNGFADGLLAEELINATIRGSLPAPRVAIIVYDVLRAVVDPDTGDRTALLRIRRAQPVETVTGRKAAEALLFDEFSTEHGPVLPFEVNSVTKAAFADLPRSISEVDEQETREQDAMSPGDELRRHLERVHGRADAVTMTDGEAEQRHEQDHAGDELPESLRHDEQWVGWTRADIEAAEAESEDFDTAVGQGDLAAQFYPMTGAEDPEVAENLLDQGALFDDDPDTTVRRAEHDMQDDADRDGDLPTRLV